MEEYRRLLWNSFRDTGLTMTDIPVSKAQLIGRAPNPLITDPTWRAVRDARTGHSIHVVSDRPFDALTNDLRMGLRLMNWMSHRPIVWYWWDEDRPRILPPYTEPSREHVNGGWTVLGEAEVHVYRREEAHKVLLHELIHALGLDIPQTVMDPIRVRFEQAMGRILWPHLGEAYTEFFAEWLWAIASPSLNVARARWTAQLACSDMQARQIWTRIRDSTKEDTNVFAYYVLKWVLMGHCEEVLFAPIATAPLWLTWWSHAKHDLKPDDSVSRELRLGMTCE
jgi:hypothetical protein